MKWTKNIVCWTLGDTLFQSIPFTWLLDAARKQASQHKGPVIAGGPAVSLMGCDWGETLDCDSDIVRIHNPYATFTSRGCIRSCKFCAVPRIEGEFREIKNFRPAPIICDNNILASSKNHFSRVIDAIKPLRGIDFNQGLDCRLLETRHIDEIKRLKYKPFIRFAFDNISQEVHVHAAVKRFRDAGFGKRRIGIYVLFGFNDTPEDALERLRLVYSWEIRPNPMRYQPIDATKKNDYVGDNWTEEELLKISKYWSRLQYYEHIPYENFNYRKGV